jgi:hypothetical protein
MAATIGKVAAVFTASTSGLVAGCDRAAYALDGINHSLAALRSGMSALVTISGARFMADLAASATLAATRIYDMGKQQAEVIDVTSKLAARLGTTYGELAGIGLAADLAGVSLGAVGKAMTKADIAFVRASQGSDLARQAFDGVGVALDSIQNLTAAERFSRLADAISALPSEAERSAAAIKLFGKAGIELLPLFSEGAKGIGEATREAQLFGVALKNAQGRDVEAMNDAFTRAGTAVKGIVVQLVARMAPTIKNITDTFTEFVTSASTVNIGRGIGDALLAGAYTLASVGDHAIEGFKNVFGLLGDIGASWETVFAAGKVTAGLFDAAAGALKTVIAAIGTALSGAVTVALQGVQTTLQAVGLSSRSVDNSLAAMKAFTASLGSAAVGGLRSAFTGGGNVLSTFSGEKIARQMERPLTTVFETAVRSGLFRAQASFKETDFARRLVVSGGRGMDAVQQMSPGFSTQAVHATGITSREGIAEMLRFIRGESKDDIAHEQLDVSKEIAKNTAAMAALQDEVAFEIAGGY